MSLHPHTTYPIPEETQRVARAAFPRGNIYMQGADRLGPLYHDAQFAALFPTRGQPAEAPARLALATVLQLRGLVPELWGMGEETLAHGGGDENRRT